MNRQEERKLKKAREWVNSLSSEKLLIIDKLAEMKAEEKFEKYKEDYKMAKATDIEKNMKEFLENREKAIKRTSDLIKEKKNKASIIKVIRKEFNLTNNEADETYRDAKNVSKVSTSKIEKKESDQDKSIEDVTVKIKAEDIKNETNEWETGNIAVGTITTGIAKVFPEGLELTAIQGTYKGLAFSKDNQGVKVGGEFFKDKDAAEKYRDNESKEIREEIDRLNKQLSDFNAKVDCIEELLVMEV